MANWLDTYQERESITDKDKVPSYQPISKQDELFRKKMYSDSLSLANQSRKLDFFYTKNPNISKEEYDRLRQLESTYPYYDFMREQYDIDKKNKNVGEFKDYINKYYIKNANNSIETTPTKSITGKDLSEGEKVRTEIFNRAIEKNPDAWIDKQGRTHEFINHGDASNRSGIEYIYDPQSGTTISKIIEKDSPEYNNTIIDIHNQYIKPTESVYKGNKNKQEINKIGLSSSSTGWYNINEPQPKFKNTSKDEYINYNHQREQRDLYPYPKQKILNAPKNAPEGEKIYFSDYIKPKEVIPIKSKGLLEQETKPQSNKIEYYTDALNLNIQGKPVGRKYLGKGEYEDIYGNPDLVRKSKDASLSMKANGGWLDTYDDEDKNLKKYTGFTNIDLLRKEINNPDYGRNFGIDESNKVYHHFRLKPKSGIILENRADNKLIEKYPSISSITYTTPDKKTGSVGRDYYQGQGWIENIPKKANGGWLDNYK